jgi:DNA-binding response OmpR family regulator
MEQKKKIFVIDDDPKLLKLLREYLKSYDFLVEGESDPLVAVESFSKIKPHLVVLDVMMPVMDGFEVLKKLRTSSTVPVIMLTARSEIADKVMGLENGADDYLAKPFEPRELVARINALFRSRSFGDPEGQIGEGQAFSLNERNNTVVINEELIELTTLEFYLLKYLIKNRGIIVTRDMIFEDVKGIESESYDRSIDVLVSRLRNKLGDDTKDPHYIKTVRGKGYQFVG